ncbi:MAG TPA: hypothetical protein VMU59_13510 [Caulobacteraceae bacterium]|nr:hypothetical protein [Caulobacteraceae bacterium]
MSASSTADALHSAQQTLADLCQGVALELEGLGEMVDQLQPAVSALLGASGGSVDPAHYEKIQSLDYISQHLRALAGFLDVLSREPPALAAVRPDRALASLTLSDLHDRLSEAGGAPQAEPDDDDPSWEMF